VLRPTDLSIPIVQAPMAGGPSTPELTIAVSEAGALGFLAAGYRGPGDVRADIEAVRAGTGKPFGVNIFVPSPAPSDPTVVDAYLTELADEAARRGVHVGAPEFTDDGWEEKLGLVCEQQVPVVSFTFGCPAGDVTERLHRAGCAVWVTVTTPAEATFAQSAGVDALVVQGAEAGGHRGGFVDSDLTFGLLALLRLIARDAELPLIAAGGIGDGAGLAAALCAGAAAGQIGTALMLAPEAGTADAQRSLLRAPHETALTRAFTGRLARGLLNRFMLDHPSAPSAYPEINNATRRMRSAARRDNDPDGFNLWAGEAHELAQRLPAAQIVTTMATDARAALRDAGQRLGQ
jgi:nitronate monooxygenase